MAKKLTALIILDGFGKGQVDAGNAIALAGIPNITALKNEYPHTTIGASGMDVGLPAARWATPRWGI